MIFVAKVVPPSTHMCLRFKTSSKQTLVSQHAPQQSCCINKSDENNISKNNSVAKANYSPAGLRNFFLISGEEDFSILLLF